LVAGLVGQGREILAQATAGLEEAGSLPGMAELDTDQALRTLGELVQTLVSGLLSGLGSVTVHSFRGYAWGLTIVGLMNGAVVGLGALLFGVPLAGPIAIVTFVTSYIPFFGAFFAGAFAVLVALGAKGLSVALAMLAITLLANNTLQNLLEPVAFGRTLRLHPLVVLLVTTAGTLLFGVLGATLAAPVTAVTLRTIGLLGDAGLFGVAATRPAAAAEVPSSLDGREASAGPALPE
jgi:predicted PurR-regulated permease PerM